MQPQSSLQPAASPTAPGDHDQPYRFGRRPTAQAPYPFNTRQYVRLLVLRGRVQDGLLSEQLSSSEERAA